jgi:hypothetical protein
MIKYVLSAYSETMQKEVRIRRKKFSMLTVSDDFNGTVFGENLMKDGMLACEEHITYFISWLSLKR